MSHLLHPPLLDEVGLSSALEQYLEGFTKRSGIDTRIETPNGEFPALQAGARNRHFPNYSGGSYERLPSLRSAERLGHYRQAATTRLRLPCATTVKASTTIHRISARQFGHWDRRNETTREGIRWRGALAKCQSWDSGRGFDPHQSHRELAPADAVRHARIMGFTIPF